MNTKQAKRGTVESALIVAICFIAIAVLMVGSIYFDDQDVKAAKAYVTR